MELQRTSWFLTIIWTWSPVPWSGAALNAFYKANPSTNCPFKLEIVLTACSPVRCSWTDNDQLHTESPNFRPRVVNTRPWCHYPNMGSYLHPNMVKNANFRGLHRIWEFLCTLRSVIILPPRQPHFLAWLPRWQLVRTGHFLTITIIVKCLKSLLLSNILARNNSEAMFYH